MRRFVPLMLAGWLLFTGLVLIAVAQEDDEEPEIRPGLVATITVTDGTQVQRIDEDVQFVGRDGPPDGRIPPGSDYRVRWQGRLFTIVPGSYQLHLYVAGKVRVELLGRIVLEAEADAPRWFAAAPVDASYGYHPLTIDYTPAGHDSRVGLYWSGPQFALEPVPDRHLVHDPKQTPRSKYDEGRLLAHALRCDHCHSDSQPPRSNLWPPLNQLRGNLSPEWLVERLTSQPPERRTDGGLLEIARRMPHFAMPRADAEAIATWLFSDRMAPSPPKTSSSEAKPAVKPSTVATSNKPEAKASKSNKPKPRTEPSADIGRTLVHSLGCLGCHRVGDLGHAGAFGGGDLSRIAEKRPAEFFVRWLEAPEKFNPAHRMPVFRIEPLERADIALYLTSLKEKAPRFEVAKAEETIVERGKRLYQQYRCTHCHGMPTGESFGGQHVPWKSPDSWQAGCLGRADAGENVPGFGLTAVQRDALREFYSARQPTKLDHLDGRLVLAERNCLGCHARGSQPGIAPHLAAVTARLPDLAPRLPTLTPPSLTGVGDKLHAEALQAAIELKHGARRPWLEIRMPKFKLSPDELQALGKLLIDHDRVPDDKPARSEQSLEPTTDLAAQRLVTADGFGCTSCHKIGNSEPVKVAINAHGTDLTLLGERIRKPWFDRWVRNPARIIPRMEMPAIQKPVRGVLHDNVDEQLAAVWTTLNTPGFDPPLPNPVRVVRTTNLDNPQERAVLLTDVMEVNKRPYLRPLVIGLPNRHNVLFDLERGGLAAWWLGDTGRERTRGKSWYWESGSTSLAPSGDAVAIGLAEPDRDDWQPASTGQFRAELDWFEHRPPGVQFGYRLQFQRSTQRRTLSVVERVLPAPQGGFRCELEIAGVKNADRITIPLGPQAAGGWRVAGLQATSAPVAGNITTIEIVKPLKDMSVELVNDTPTLSLVARGERPIQVEIAYRLSLPADQYHPVEVNLPPIEPVKLNIVPGFDAMQLPLPADEMPTALDWKPDGTLVFASLKGRVCIAKDTDGDGLEDRITPISDDMAAPYGLHVNRDSIDVINKYALLRLHDRDGDGQYERSEVVADDWGYTTDYHDWAVGLPQDEAGNYYISLPCQQDDRSPLAARRRGMTLRLSPIDAPNAQRKFAIHELTAGHRFPMGLAINRQQAIFVTDNQGNYTPFNELNHLRDGHRFGFINKLEVKPGFAPPYEPAAIDIPHPWTRSVNGICFLYTPEPVRQRTGRDAFGPFEGHLVGCEFNGLSLVRMTLEPIGDTYQGAVYPLSVQPPADQPTFEGPVSCAINPHGDLYIGNMRDSGWGGGQNTGSIVRLRPTGKWPLGIAEVRAMPDGFQLQFTGPIDAAKAAVPTAYSIRSYRRIPTPAYGGADVDERTEHVKRAEVSSDRTSVNLRLGQLREGFVYEIRVANIGGEAELLHPAEAHYTLRQAPR